MTSALDALVFVEVCVSVCCQFAQLFSSLAKSLGFAPFHEPLRAFPVAFST